MAYGGGIFSIKNKILPGSYINFVSTGNVDANVSERGVVAVCRAMGWGKKGITVLTKEDFQKNCATYFAYACTDRNMKFLREIFQYSSKVILYNCNESVRKAANTYGESRYPGYAGNLISIEVLQNHDSSFTVTTYFINTAVDVQKVRTAAQLIDNAYVVFNKDADLDDTQRGGLVMTGGVTEFTPAAYVAFLNAIESYSFNVLCCDIEPNDDPEDTDAVTRKMFVEYTKRRRDSDGVKFQLVIMDEAADYEGVISLKNEYGGTDKTELVYWVSGVCAGMTAGQSAMNLKYDGECELDKISADYTGAELENFIKNGYFVLHRANDEIRVLSDINSLVTVTDTKGSVFKQNQTIRICDQIANDIALLFNTKYIGRVPNDKAGRLSLWSDIVRFHEQLEELRAIEDFKEDDIIVERGDTKTSVVIYEAINVVNGMGQLYMTVTVV